MTELLPSNDHTTQIIKRKLNGYVGFANLPKQWHRKSIRKGFNFNLMIVGEKGLGKSTLINTLFNKDLFDLTTIKPLEDLNKIQIETINSIIEENNVKLNLQIINCKGFGEFINNSNSFQPIIDEIDSRFDSYLDYETKINRNNLSNDFIDERIHALLYFIEPTGHSLKSLDINFMKSIHEKVNLIPIIAKSDILNETEVENFKLKIKNDLKNQNINIFNPIKYENDDNNNNNIEDDENLNILNKMPFAIVGSNNLIKLDDGRFVRGREYPWGKIEIDNELHNDFIKLRQLLIRNYMEDLKDLTSNKLYENYRLNKLTKMGIIQNDSVFKEFDPILKQEEEKKLHELKLVNLENQMKQIFQQKVNREEKKLQETEADLFSKHKEMRDKLLKQIKMLEDKKKELESNNKLIDQNGSTGVSHTQQQQQQQSSMLLNSQQQQQQQPTKTRKGFLRG